MILNDDNDENRRTVENCYRTKKLLVNPIIDWEDEDVWEFLNEVVNVPHCELYDKGYKRLGCIGCPMKNSNQTKELERYPKYKAMYMRAFERMLNVLRERGKESIWQTAEDVYKWWVRLHEMRPTKKDGKEDAER